MEPASKLSELMWSSNSTTDEVQHNYPPSGSSVSADEAEMISQLLTSYSNDQTLSSWSSEPQAPNTAECEEFLDSSVYFCSDSANSSLYYWQQGTNSQEFEMYSNGSRDSTYCYMGSDQSRSGRYHAIEQNQWGDAAGYGKEMGSNGDFEDLDATKSFDSFLRHNKNVLPKRKPEIDDTSIGLSADPGDNSKKKTKILNAVQRGGKNTQAKKTHKTKNDEVDDNVGLSLQTTTSNNSEDESTVSHDHNGTNSSSIINLNGKNRAGRGSATDPQSLYARKRRERINERLRILQNLVPNGTKVDMSTMLEEAVQYVKFLQLQIKLLSSDDLWMYAPIAYNGMNIGLDLKIS